jgi:hypothetical protein
MERFETIEKIPTWALCYIINGDPTGLSDSSLHYLFLITANLRHSDETTKYFSEYLIFYVGMHRKQDALGYNLPFTRQYDDQNRRK